MLTFVFWSSLVSIPVKHTHHVMLPLPCFTVEVKSLTPDDRYGQIIKFLFNLIRKQLSEMQELAKVFFYTGFVGLPCVNIFQTMVMSTVWQRYSLIALASFSRIMHLALLQKLFRDTLRNIRSSRCLQIPPNLTWSSSCGMRWTNKRLHLTTYRSICCWCLGATWIEIF